MRFSLKNFWTTSKWATSSKCSKPSKLRGRLRRNRHGWRNPQQKSLTRSSVNSELIRLELRDPRGDGDLDRCRVTRDNAHAKIFFTSMGNEAQVLSCQHGLQSASGFLRSQLANRLPIRTSAAIAFRGRHSSIARGAQLSNSSTTPRSGSQTPALPRGAVKSPARGVGRAVAKQTGRHFLHQCSWLGKAAV